MCHAALAGKIGQDVFQCGDAEHGQTIQRLHFLYRGGLACTALHPVERDQDSGRFSLGGADQLDGFAHRCASRYDIVQNQYLAGQWRPHDDAALAVILGLLAIEAEGHIAPGSGKRNGCRGNQGDALIGGTKDHIEGHRRSQNGVRVEFPQPCQCHTGVEQSGIEEVR